MKAPIKMMFPLEMYFTENGNLLITQEIDSASQCVALTKEQAAIVGRWLLDASEYGTPPADLE